MKFVSIETATAESIEDALDDAFELFGVVPREKYSLLNDITSELNKFLDSFLEFNSMDKSRFIRGRTKDVVVMRRNFVLSQLHRGFTAAEICRATGLAYGTVTKIKQRAAK